MNRIAPFRESGDRYSMEYYAGRGGVAEASRIYERLRVLLRNELGISQRAARGAALGGW